MRPILQAVPHKLNLGLRRGPTGSRKARLLPSSFAAGTPKGAGGVRRSVSPRVPAVGAMSAAGGAKSEPLSRPLQRRNTSVQAKTVSELGRERESSSPFAPPSTAQTSVQAENCQGANFPFLGAKGSASASSAISGAQPRGPLRGRLNMVCREDWSATSPDGPIR